MLYKIAGLSFRLRGPVAKLHSLQLPGKSAQCPPDDQYNTSKGELRETLAAAETSSVLFYVWRIPRTFALCLFIAITPMLHAGSAQWSQSPGNGNWNEPSNWMPPTVPNGPADIATFASSDVTSVSISANTNEQVSGIIFNTGASSYTVTAVEMVGTCCFVMTIGGAGIVNNSGITQNFVTNSASSGHGQFRFTGQATAGMATIFTSNGAAFATFEPFVDGVVFNDNSSADYAMFVNNPGSGSGGDVTPGSVSFEGNSTAGHGRFVNNGGGFNLPGSKTSFLGNASAGEGSFVNNGATAGTSQNINGGLTTFRYSATAGNATFANNGGLAMSAIGGGVIFSDNSTAGTATVNNNPGVANGAAAGFANFIGMASADRAILVNEGSSAIDNQSAGQITFGGNATAANSLITNNGGTLTDARGAGTSFRGNARADDATLFANGGSNGGQGARIQFEVDSNGGNARIVLAGNGVLTIAAHNSPGVTIGSLEGSGSVLLGNNNLTVGSRNTSTLFSGMIQDGGSLAKIGSGALTLSGANTYSGTTTINAGKLAVDGSIMGAVTVNNGGTLAGSGTTGSVTVNSGGIVAPGGSQILHINGNYAQNVGGVLKIEVTGADPSAVRPSRHHRERHGWWHPGSPLCEWFSSRQRTGHQNPQCGWRVCRHF